MIDQTRVHTQPTELARDERSMRLLEYAMAFIALGVVFLLSLPQ
jgi:hypothetical protein